MPQALAIAKQNNANPLAALKKLFEGDLKEVDRLIETHLNSQAPLVPLLSRHLIAAGGKRLRPLLTIAAYRLFQEEGNGATSLAAAVEFIHTATLLHDDVVDGSRLRRGLASANELWGNQASVLVGDFLFARSFQLMIEADSREALQILSAAAARISEGEVLQLSVCRNLNIRLEELLQIIEAKTAELFAAACHAGAIMAAAHHDAPLNSPSNALALRRYGKNLGMAFQIVDDILDYSSTDNQLGKEAGDDFREGKITLPIILAYPYCENSEKQFLKRTLVDRSQTMDDFPEILKILENRGGIRKSYDLARQYGRQALQALDHLPCHPIRDLLADLVEYCLQRHCQKT